MQHSKKLEALRQKLAYVGDNLRNVHTNGLALRKNVEEMQRAFIERVGNRNSDPIGHVDNARGGMVVESRAAGVEIAAASQLLEVLENSAQFKKAAELIEPLLAEIATIEAEELAVQHEVLKRQADVNAARALALEKAKAEAEKHPAVLAASKQLESAQSLALKKLAAV